MRIRQFRGKRQEFRSVKFSIIALAINTLKSVSWTGGKPHLDFIKSVIFDKTKSVNLRREATRFLGSSWGGEDMILAYLKEGKIQKDFIPVAVDGVSRAWRRAVRVEASQYLGNSATTTKIGRAHV